MKQILTLLLLLLLTTGQAVRVAIIGTGKAAQALGDLVMAENGERYEFVERAALELVFREKRLNAAAASGADFVGTLWPADLLLLIESAIENEIEYPSSARIIDLNRGLRLANFPLDATAPQPQLTRHLAAAVQRSENPTQSRYLSQLACRDRGLPSTLLNEANQFQARLEHALQQLPDTIILERDHLKRLLDEKYLTGKHGKLELSALAYQLDFTPTNDLNGYTTTLTLTDNTGNILQQTQFSGDQRCDPAPMLAMIASALKTALPQLNDPVKEASLFFREGLAASRRNDYQTALQKTYAAIALDPYHINYRCWAIHYLEELHRDIQENPQKWICFAQEMRKLYQDIPHNDQLFDRLQYGFDYLWYHTPQDVASAPGKTQVLRAFFSPDFRELYLKRLSENQDRQLKLAKTEKEQTKAISRIFFDTQWGIFCNNAEYLIYLMGLFKRHQETIDAAKTSHLSDLPKALKAVFQIASSNPSELPPEFRQLTRQMRSSDHPDVRNVAELLEIIRRLRSAKASNVRLSKFFQQTNYTWEELSRDHILYCPDMDIYTKIRSRCLLEDPLQALAQQWNQLTDEQKNLHLSQLPPRGLFYFTQKAQDKMPNLERNAFGRTPYHTLNLTDRRLTYLANFVKASCRSEKSLFWLTCNNNSFELFEYTSDEKIQKRLEIPNSASSSDKSPRMIALADQLLVHHPDWVQIYSLADNKTTVISDLPKFPIQNAVQLGSRIHLFLGARPYRWTMHISMNSDGGDRNIHFNLQDVKQTILGRKEYIRVPTAIPIPEQNTILLITHQPNQSPVCYSYDPQNLRFEKLHEFPAIPASRGTLLRNGDKIQLNLSFHTPQGRAGFLAEYGIASGQWSARVVHNSPPLRDTLSPELFLEGNLHSNEEMLLTENFLWGNSYNKLMLCLPLQNHQTSPPYLMGNAWNIYRGFKPDSILAVSPWSIREIIAHPPESDGEKSTEIP